MSRRVQRLSESEDQVEYELVNLNLQHDSEAIVSQTSGGQSETPLMKQEHRNFMTYVRQNYLKLFMYFIVALVTFILAMIVLIVIIIYQHQRIEQMAMNISSQRVAEELTGNESVPISVKVDVQSSTPNVNVHVTLRRTEKEDVSTIKNGDTIRIKCYGIQCQNYYCHDSSMDYDAVVQYICCNCLERKYKLVRIVEDVLRDRISLILRVDRKIENYSTYDLRNIPPLRNLTGTWSLLREDDYYYRLKYGNIQWKN